MNDIFLILFLIFSIIINISLVLLYIKKRGTKKIIEKLSLKESKKIEIKSLAIPEIYTKNKLSLSYKNNVTSQNNFNEWKNNLILKFQKLHEIPNTDEISVQNIEKLFSKKFENYLLTKYTTDAQDNDKIIFYELVPKEIKKNNPVIFIIPGSGNQGAKDVINLDSENSKFYYQLGIGEKLANEGYTVYVIENRGSGERTINTNMCENSDPFCSGEVLERQMKNLGFDLVNLQIIDTLQIFKSLDNFKMINTKNIFLLGIGHGGKIALRSSLFLPELKAILLSSSLFSTDYFGTFGNGFNSGFLKYFDNPDLAIAFAPKPLYVSWGINETPPHYFEAKSLYSAGIIKNAYSLLEKEKNFTSVVHNQTINSGHTVDPSSILSFIKQYC